MITTQDERKQVADEIFDKIKDSVPDLKITHDRFVDLFDVRKEGFNFYIPEPASDDYKVGMVNVFLSKKTYKREGFLFTISLFLDKDNPDLISANIPAVGHDLWGNDWIKLYHIMFNYEYAKDILSAIYDYLTNNLIVYCLNMIKDDAPEVYECAYVKALVAKAKQDYSELQLIIQASSI